MNSIEKYKKDGATILTWTNDEKNEIDYAKMEGGHILIKLNKLSTSIRLYGINQKIAIVGAKCIHSKGIDSIIIVNSLCEIALDPSKTMDYVWDMQGLITINNRYLHILAESPIIANIPDSYCYLILDYMVI